MGADTTHMHKPNAAHDLVTRTDCMSHVSRITLPLLDAAPSWDEPKSYPSCVSSPSAAPLTRPRGVPDLQFALLEPAEEDGYDEHGHDLDQHATE